MHAVPIRRKHEPRVGSRWYRSSNFANVVYVSGHIFLNTRFRYVTALARDVPVLGKTGAHVQ